LKVKIKVEWLSDMPAKSGRPAHSKGDVGEELMGDLKATHQF
jgi:hypothetical protein